MSDQTPTLRWCFTHDEPEIRSGTYYRGFCAKGVESDRGDGVYETDCACRDAVVVSADEPLYRIVQNSVTYKTVSWQVWLDDLMEQGVLVPVYQKEET